MPEEPELEELQSLVEEAHEMATRVPASPYQDELCGHLASAMWVIGRLQDGATEDAPDDETGGSG